MHTTRDLWDMHRYMGSNHTPNLVTSAQPFLRYSLARELELPNDIPRTRNPGKDRMIIGKRNSAATQKGNIIGQQGCLYHRHSIFTRWSVSAALRTVVYNYMHEGAPETCLLQSGSAPGTSTPSQEVKVYCPLSARRP